MAAEEREEPKLWMSVHVDDAQWRHDSEEEFFRDYRRSNSFAHYRATMGTVGITLLVHDHHTTEIEIEASHRTVIERAFDIFDEAQVDAQVVPTERSAPVVFIGHGQSTQWRQLKDHLQDHHHIKVEAYEVGARAGHAIRDILEDMMDRSSFAALVLTAEDEMADGGYRARQNVIHETGLFQGKLGFTRAIVLLEEGTEEFSNINGIQQIRFSRGNIRETFGDVLATIKREFDVSTY